MIRRRTSRAEIAAWLGPGDRIASAAVAALAGLVAAATAGPAAIVPLALLGADAVAIAVIDGRRHLVPDLLSLPLLPLGMLWTLVQPAGGPSELLVRTAAAAILTLALLLLRALAGWRTGRTALGLGDVKLMAAAALWIPADLLPGFVFCSAVGGLVEAMRRGRNRPIAFGRHLAPWLLLFVLADAVGSA